MEKKFTITYKGNCGNATTVRANDAAEAKKLLEEHGGTKIISVKQG